MNLRNRTILITGGSAGIGLAYALKFLELGNDVIVTGRRQTVLDEVKAKYPKLHTIQGDVADPAQIASLATRVKAEYPRLDRKSTRLNSSHVSISYAVFCLKKKKRSESQRRRA